MIFCFRCITEDDRAVPRPGTELASLREEPNRTAYPAVTIAEGKAMCHKHLSRLYREPIRELGY